MRLTNALSGIVDPREKVAHHQPVGELLDQDYGIHCEEYFNSMLCLERKRSERTGGPILLLLINIEKVGTTNGSDQRVKAIVAGLMSCIREVDLCGWHAYHCSIGVMFTALDNGQVWLAAEVVADKINESLKKALPPEVVKQLEVIFHIFPEKYDKGKPKNFINPTFYPDMKERSMTLSLAVAVKRAMDVVGSVVGLLLFSPLFLIIPLLIRCTSAGPVLFKQERIGQFGRRFTFLKFRSMYTNNDDSIHRRFLKQFISGDRSCVRDDGAGARAPVYKITQDPRITPIGHLLRKTSMDELPQFINVLKGEMSLVGPRPPIPYEFDDYDIWHRYRLLKMKPGITGLWQVKGRSLTSFDGMVRFDINYIRNWSLWLDIKILLLTPFAVIKCRGAY